MKTTGAGWCISFICQTCSLCPASPPPSPEFSCLSFHTLPFNSSVLSLQNGVVHRDLKLENILLDDNCNIKVKLRWGPGYGGWAWPVGVAGSEAASPSAGRKALGKTASKRLIQTVYFSRHGGVPYSLPVSLLPAGTMTDTQSLPSESSQSGILTIKVTLVFHVYFSPHGLDTFIHDSFRQHKRWALFIL